MSPPYRRERNVLPISKLWYSFDCDEWSAALDRYRLFIRPDNLALERAVDPLDHGRIRALDAEGWYRFLRDEYFRWKFTRRDRYATFANTLDRTATKPGGLDQLFAIRDRLLEVPPREIAGALLIAERIPGLGPAGASGLLALLHPSRFGTADQFVVKALRAVPDLPEANQIAGMTPENLLTDDAVVLIGIMRRKASELATVCSGAWTPRMIDKVLWTYGR